MDSSCSDIVDEASVEGVYPLENSEETCESPAVLVDAPLRTVSVRLGSWMSVIAPPKTLLRIVLFPRVLVPPKRLPVRVRVCSVVAVGEIGGLTARVDSLGM